METKKCIKCGMEKELSFFRIRSETGRYRNECKQCISEYNKQYREKNKEKIKIYFETHKTEIALRHKKYSKQYRQINKEKIRDRAKKYRQTNAQKIKDHKQKYYIENRDKILKRRKEYRMANSKKLSEKQRIYYAQHKKERVLYETNRLKNDTKYHLTVQLRNLIRHSFVAKGLKKNTKTEKILGMKPNEFVLYLLKTFKDNYGYEWDGIEKVHIDHKKPLATAKTEEDVIELNHYTNLQLLKAEDNLKKGANENWKKE